MLFLDKNAMKRKLLILLLLCYVYNGIGQTTETITIDWGFNSTPSASGNANTNRTIEVGDTVIWNWYSNGTHNVNSLPSATETFESAYFGNGGSFSYTFMSEGDNPFQCDPHAGIMFGTITVVANGTLSIDTNMLNSVSVYPNPVNDILNIDIPKKIDNGLNIAVFDALGKQVMFEKLNNLKSSFSVSELNAGIYLMKLTSSSQNMSVTKRFVKL